MNVSEALRKFWKFTKNFEADGDKQIDWSLEGTP